MTAITDTLLRPFLLIGLTLLALVNGLAGGVFDRFFEERQEVKTRHCIY